MTPLCLSGDADHLGAAGHSPIQIEDMLSRIALRTCCFMQRLEPVLDTGSGDILSCQMADMVQTDLVSKMLVPARLRLGSAGYRFSPT